MTKTVLMAGLYHETHTFLAQKTDLAAFRQGGLSLGQQVIDTNLGNGSPTDGFLSTAAAQGWRVIPTIQMAAMPSGTVQDSAMTYFKEQFFGALDPVADQIDAIFLVLHGAMVSESSDDVEGDLLAAIDAHLRARNIDIPVVGVIDLHANVSQKMTDFSTCLYSYRENPHNDARDAAVQAARLLGQLLDTPGPVRQVHLATPHVIPPTGLATANDPMRATLKRARQIEAADPDLLCINVMGGYAYADIADCGFSLNCCTRGNPDTARRYLAELLAVFESHLTQAYPLERPLDAVLADIADPPKGPVLLIEPADNIGGGTPGDGTGILAPLLATGRRNIVAILNDPQAVAACVTAGQGAEIDLLIGAKTDRYHGDPVAFQGHVQRLSDGVFDLENKQSHLASMMGIRIDMGGCAVIENAQARILLTSRKTPPMDLGQLHSQGIRPEDADFVIIKAAVSHKDAYDPIARASHYIDSAGLCTSNLKRLPYRKLTGKCIALPVVDP